MIRKYHNHKLQTNPWHREEEPQNNHETPGRQNFHKLADLIFVTMSLIQEWLSGKYINELRQARWLSVFFMKF